MERRYQYKTHGTCSRLIDFTLDGETITSLSFTGGCNGNLKAIGRLVNGHNAHEIADLLEGNTCGPRPTSCADQLSKALNEALAQQKAEGNGEGKDA